MPAAWEQYGTVRAWLNQVDEALDAYDTAIALGFKSQGVFVIARNAPVEQRTARLRSG